MTTLAAEIAGTPARRVRAGFKRLSESCICEDAFCRIDRASGLPKRRWPEPGRHESMRHSMGSACDDRRPRFDRLSTSWNAARSGLRLPERMSRRVAAVSAAHQTCLSAMCGFVKARVGHHTCFSTRKLTSADLVVSRARDSKFSSLSESFLVVNRPTIPCRE